MADYTENYGFKKPSGSDKFSIEDFNGNMDMIDAAISQSSTSGQSEPAVAALSADALTSEAVTAEYYPPQNWTYEKGEGSVSTTLTVQAKEKGLMIVAVSYNCLDSNSLTVRLSGEGWTKLHTSASLQDYFTVIDIYTKPVEAGSHEISITQKNTGTLFYAHAFCLYDAVSAEVVKDMGTSKASYTADVGTVGKRRLYFTQQGPSATKGLTVENLPDCGIIDSIYLATVWDICFAETSAPTLKYSSGPMGVVIMEVTMEG